ncbi:MAG: sulfite exporter TauE/SafE family protein [Pseudomonadota bacterium]|nr:sulfite exporter TauE/SafE family protein [Pseudomonadota bacterium]
MIDAGSIGISAAFIAGVAGSSHCFAMCGGMAAALGMHSRVTSTDARGAFVNAGAYQLGRIGGYAFVGALFGFAGALLQSMFDLMRIGAVLRIASGMLLILIALRMLIRWNALSAIERLGARFWSRIRPLAQRAVRSHGRGRAIAIGILWGWLPCGLVYSMLMFAATSGNALHGAALMAAFGFGTLPSMLTSSLLASQLQRALAQRWPRIISGLLLMAFGIWMMIVPALRAGHAGHVH